MYVHAYVSIIDDEMHLCFNNVKYSVNYIF